MTDKPKKKRLWEFDPTVFQPGRKATLLERTIQPFRSGAKYVLYGLVLIYPIILITLGLMFGGLVFWTSFVGSVALMGLIIKKAGYAQNFQTWDIGFKKLLALVGAFLLTFAFWEGLFILKAWLIPAFAAFLAVGLFVVLRRRTI